MITDQHPLGSGFTAETTADDVLQGVDLAGKHIIVTGGHSRLGREVTRALATAGAEVTVAVRDPERAATALAGLAGIRIEQLDLTEPASIHEFAERWAASGRPLDALINNAAVLSAPERYVDARDNEVSFSTSHLGHFRLTKSLVPALRSANGARVVTVTSGAARFGRIHWDDPSLRTGYTPFEAYGQSKLANVLFTVELDRRYQDDGIRAFAAHPGVVIGPGPHHPDGLASYRTQGLVDTNGATIIDPAAGKKTSIQGAATIVFGAISSVLDGIGGLYLKDSDVARLDDTAPPLTATSIPSDANTAMLDPTDAARLWAITETLCS